MLEALNGAWSAAGQDPIIGRRLPALLREAGLTNVGFDADALVWQTGHPYRTLPLKFVSIFQERIVAGGFIDARRLDGLIAEAELHLAKPARHLRHSPLFFQAWGRKPADQPDDLAREIERDVARVARRQPQIELTALDQFGRDPVPAELKRFVPVPAETPRDPKGNQTATGGLGAAVPSSAGR